jgi:hypothetical protein
VSSRKIDDQVLTLSASGWTYFNRFVLYDYETESLWFCLGDGSCELTCVSGEFADRKLEKLAWSATTWQEWKGDHPDTKYMEWP